MEDEEIFMQYGISHEHTVRVNGSEELQVLRSFARKHGCNYFTVATSNVNRYPFIFIDAYSDGTISGMHGRTNSDEYIDFAEWKLDMIDDKTINTSTLNALI